MYILGTYYKYLTLALNTDASESPASRNYLCPPFFGNGSDSP